MIAIAFVGDNASSRTVLARIYEVADTSRNPGIARFEFLVLHALGDAGIPVPLPLRAFEAGVVADRPCLVTSFVEGSTHAGNVAPEDVVEQIAEVLLAIHSINVPDALAQLLPHAQLDAQAIATLDARRVWTTGSNTWAATAFPGPHSHGPEVLLHGDVWPGNFIWQEGHLAAVIDWEDAQLGDARFDVANAFVEFSLAFGRSTAKRFLHHYATRKSGISADLDVFVINQVRRLEPRISGFGLSGDEERAMRERLSDVRSWAEASIGHIAGPPEMDSPDRQSG